MKLCNINLCENEVLNSHGWCARHYMKWYRHGDPLYKKVGRGRTGTSTTWTAMKQRCSNKNAPDYHNYGGRGISCSSNWELFSNFVKDMGERPHGHTLERIDNNGDYCKDNCRWASREEQSNNKRDTIFLTYDGRKRSITQWSKELGIERRNIYWRVKNGWSVERALNKA